ncbi:MAG: hypothetical protein K2Q20_01840 [Phycisphaerales bacterium]|nr:hypothetical protein [Phycisphaerales bacterium]
MPALSLRLGRLGLIASMLIGFLSAVGCRAPAPGLAANMPEEQLRSILTRELSVGTPRSVVESRMSKLNLGLPVTQIVDYESGSRVVAGMPESPVRFALERGGWRVSPPRPTPEHTLVYELLQTPPRSGRSVTSRVEPSLRGLVLAFSSDQRLDTAAVTPWIGYRPNDVYEEGFVVELRQQP